LYSLKLDVDISNLSYFYELNRGGLIYPSSTLLHAFQSVHAIFNTCISGNFEKLFVKLQSPKHYLLDCTLFLSIGQNMV